jgi:hypothetical protein
MPRTRWAQYALLLVLLGVALAVPTRSRTHQVVGRRWARRSRSAWWPAPLAVADPRPGGAHRRGDGDAHLRPVCMDGTARSARRRAAVVRAAPVGPVRKRPLAARRLGQRPLPTGTGAHRGDGRPDQPAHRDRSPSPGRRPGHQPDGVPHRTQRAARRAPLLIRPSNRPPPAPRRSCSPSGSGSWWPSRSPADPPHDYRSCS